MHEQQGHVSSSSSAFTRLPAPVREASLVRDLQCSLPIDVFPFTIPSWSQFDRAKEAYERVLAENATHAKVLQQLGGLYCREGSNFYNSDEAVAILTRSLAAGELRF